MNWYVNASTGNDSNPGTAAAKLATLGALAGKTLAPGDTCYLEGTFREHVTFSDLVSVTFRKGSSAWFIRGDTVITGFSASGSGYTKTLATGLNIKSVVINWDASINTNGLHYGHLTLAADAATALATPGTYYYASGTGVLSFNSGANPATQTVAWCAGGVNGFTLTNATNCVVDDFRAALFCDSTSGMGFVGSGTGNTLRIDRIDDCGSRHAAFVGVGVANSDNTIEPSTLGMGRCAGLASGGTSLSYYADSASQGGAYTRDIRVWATPHLKLDGTTGTHTGSISGCSSYTSGDVMEDVTWFRVHVSYPYTVATTSTPFSAANTTAPTAAALSRTDPASYGARFIECRVDGAKSCGLLVGAAGSVLYQRCHMLFPDTSKNQGGVVTSASDTLRKQVLFDACEFIFNLDGASTGRAFKVHSNEDWLFLNCSAVDTGTGSNARILVQADWISSTGANNTGCYYMRQCVFVYIASAASIRRFMSNDSLTNNSANANSVVPRDFADCAYVNCTAQTSLATYDSQAEWTASIDTTARYDATNPFEQPIAAGQPVSSLRLSVPHALYTHRAATSSSPSVMGINWKPNTKTLGCYQYGAGPAFTELNP